MNTTALIIEIPDLDDEAAAMMQQFFYSLMEAFEAQYYPKIERYYRNYQQDLQHDNVDTDNLDLNQDPF